MMNEPIAERSAPAKQDRQIGGRAGALVLAAATIAGIVVCVLLAAPFLGALTWALTLAILFVPLHAGIEATLKQPDLAAMAAILLALDGSWGNAVILAVWGTVVVGGIDNILRPTFGGNRLSLHTVPAFISMIGSLVLFGASGFILGPLTVTVTILLIEIWETRDQADQSKSPG